MNNLREDERVLQKRIHTQNRDNVYGMLADRKPLAAIVRITGLREAVVAELRDRWHNPKRFA